MKRTPLFISSMVGFYGLESVLVHGPYPWAQSHGFRSNSTFSDPTSTRGRSCFCRQIHHLGRNDRAPSSFGEVILPSAIQLLSGDDRLLPSDPPPGRSDRTPSSFGDVVLPLTIQLLSEDDRVFAVRSTPGRSDRAPSSFREVEAKLYYRRLLGEAKVELHLCRPLKATTY
ncbi:hypothetical protein E6C27_scaffold560G00360 [Cucumis melo var. makuwa]|uniref:Uncharacterized protein n=1 Tax=Cucumis melo var. makuwa TaxID=1194695 RepID=A0A5A7U4H5_CUCMM|nr:hypothetical protein E6C27_scaffold560G00360 [Cucumis melo var. makuwa]